MRSGRQHSVWFAMVAFLLLAPLESAAAPKDQSWKEGLKLYKTYQFKKAIPLLNKVLVDPPKAWTGVEKARAYLYLSLCHYNLGDSQRAERIFKKADALVPGIQIPLNMPKRIRAHYAKLQISWRAARALKRKKPPPPRRAIARRIPKARPVRTRPKVRARKVALQKRVPLPKSQGFAHTGSLVVLGIGVAASAVALGFSLASQKHQAAQQKLEDAREQGENITNLQFQEEYNAGYSTALASTLLWVAGGAALGTGVVLLFVELGRKKKPAAITNERNNSPKALRLVKFRPAVANDFTSTY